MEPLYVRFGRELRRVRKRKKVTQSELADRVALGRTSIVNIESGRQRVHLHTFLELASALDVEPDELLPEIPEQNPEIALRVGTLPEPERDWVMRVVASPTRRRKRRSTGGAKT